MSLDDNHVPRMYVMTLCIIVWQTRLGRACICAQKLIWARQFEGVCTQKRYLPQTITETSENPPSPLLKSFGTLHKPYSV